MKKQNKWLDNFGKADNANESNVSLPEDFVGLAYDTSGRNYSPSWGGQFAMGGSIPGSPGFTYARTAGSAPSEGKYAKKTMPSAQNGIQQDETRIDTPIADKIAGLELQKDPRYQYWKYQQSLPQLRQGLSREEEFKRDALRYADITTDVMQLANFIPHPAAQFVGRVGNVAGGIIDFGQAVGDVTKGDYLSAGINATSAFLPNYLGSKGKGYLRSINNVKPNSVPDKISRLTEEGKFYRPLVYAKPSHVSNPVITRGLNFNKSVLGTNLIETGYDASDPKFQNGGEMKFYQEGLDWKPKSMKNGGEEKPRQVSTTDPEYRNLYENRQVGSWSPEYQAYNLPDLPEVTVTGKDESLKEAMSQGSSRFLQNALGVMGSSQTVPMEFLTGKQQTPSEAWGFNTEGLSWYNPKSISNFAMDAVLDPMNVIGVGVADDLSRMSLRGLQSATNNPTKNLSILNKFNDLRVPLSNVNESIKYELSTIVDKLNPIYQKNAKRELTKGNDWQKNWYTHPETLRRIDELSQAENYAKRAEIDEFNQRLISQFPSAKPLDYSIGNTDWDIVRKRALNPTSYKSKFQSRTAKLKNLIGGLERTHLGNYGVSGYGLDSDYVTGIRQNLVDKYSSKIQSTAIHEGNHGLTDGNLFIPHDNQDKIVKIFGEDQKVPERDIMGRYNSYDDYYKDPTEVYARVMELRNYMGLQPGQIVDDQMIDELLNSGISAETPVDKRFFNLISDKEKFKDLFNWLPQVTLPIAGGVAVVNSQIQNQDTTKYKKGGVIKDNRGQWNHPGEITEIDSPYITMQGVPYNVLGVSDTGDAKLMEPGKDYKFKGKKVTEFPLKAQEGIKVPEVEGSTLPEVLVTDIPERISRQNQLIQGTSPKRNYSIVDKKNNYIYYFSPKGEKIGTEPIITGASNNDVDVSPSMREFFEMRDTDNHEEYFQYLKDTKGQTTPSGIYSISGLRTDTAKNPDKLGSLFNKLFRPEREKEIEDIRIKDYGAQQNLFTLQSEFGVPSSKAIHGTMRDDRVDALENYDRDRNMSNGCVNVNGETMCFETLEKGSGVYILPEESDDLLYPSEKNNKERKTNKNYRNTRSTIAQELLSRGIEPEKEALDFIASVAEKETKGGRSKFAAVEQFAPHALAKSQGKFQIDPSAFKQYLPEDYDGSDSSGAEAVYNFFNENKEIDPVNMYRKYTGDEKGKYDKKFKSIYDKMSIVYRDGGRVGINDLDAQPKKKLNQLLNFTNNPDKDWLKKYQ